MTTTINASTSSGLVNTADTSGILQLQTASTAALTIDASQNVGIGTASPVGKLSVYNSSSGIVATFQNATTGATASDGSYVALNGNDLQISNKESANMIFYTADTEHMRINSSGYVTKPNQPSFWVARNNGTAATGTDIVYNDVKFNIGSGYNSSNGRFTAPVTGYYFITASGINLGTTNVLFELLIMLNGTNVTSARGYHASNATVGGATVTQVINLTAGDYVTIRPDVTTMYGSESRTAFFCGYLLG